MWRPHSPVSNLVTGTLTLKCVHKFLPILSTHLDRCLVQFYVEFQIISLRTAGFVKTGGV
jgi:hypothetical protein